MSKNVNFSAVGDQPVPVPLRVSHYRRVVATVIGVATTALVASPAAFAQGPEIIPIQSTTSIPSGVPLSSTPPGKLVVSAAGAASSVVSSAQPLTAVVASAEASKALRFADPLADLAAATLAALKGRPVGPVSASASQGVASAVQTLSAPQNSVPGFAPAPGASTELSSVIIDTEDLSTYFLGTAIVAPSAPTTQTILAGLSKNPDDRYPQALHQVALAVASQIKGAKAADLEAVWNKTDVRRMTVILTALAQVGTQYRWTGNQPGGFDCSGLTSYSWAKAGIKIPRVSGDQISAANPKSAADLLPGDLLYRPGHIGLYLGVSDYMVHSPQTGKSVEVKTWGRMTRFGSPI